MNSSGGGKGKGSCRINIIVYRNAILCLCFFGLFSSVGAQTMGGSPGSDQPYPYTKFSPSMAIIVVVLIAALFFMGFFSIYIRHCSEASTGGGNIRGGIAMRSRRASRGLDPAVIETFPTFPYSEVKSLKIGKGALECAVCITEFEDEETLRLLPKCDHVFHPECIDAWLVSHVTCPVCRANLVPVSGESNDLLLSSESQPTDNNENIATVLEQETQQSADVSIRVLEDNQVNNVQNQPQLPPRPPVVNRNLSFDQSRQSRSRYVRSKLFSKFRSNSTGHSLVRAGENLDRYTLRLPEEVRREMMSRAMLCRTVSTVTRSGPGDGGSSRRGYRTGEGSSRGRSSRGLESLDLIEAKSDRWVFSMTPPFFSRGPSFKSPKVVANGDGSTSSRTPRVLTTKLSFNCLEPKSSDETGLVAADSARPPV